jgi:hypothetical protein
MPMISRERHPRLWAITIWCVVSAIPILLGWIGGSLAIPRLLFWGLLALWMLLWIVVSVGLWMTLAPGRKQGDE